MSLPRFAVLVLAAAVPARAQDARFAFQTELIVDTPGRTGECDMIQFTPDGKHLLSCGDDKVIHSWSWDGKTLRPDQNATLRWSIYRERRGNIYAFAVSRDGSKVAVGGHGQFVGTAAVIDRETGKILNATTPDDSDDVAKQRSIWSMAFSPSGRRVAYGSMDGHVWAWDYVDGRHRRLGSHSEVVVKRNFQAAKRSLLDDAVWGVEFLDEDRLVSVCQDGSVLEWNWSQKGPARRLFQFEKLPNIRNVAFDRKNKRFAACGDAGGTATVEVRNLDGTAPVPPLTLPTLAGASEFPRHLAFDPSGRRLAVGTYQIPQKTFYQYSGGHVYVFDLEKPAEPAWRARQLDYNAIALTWHPTQNVLAVVGGNNHDVQLLEMTRPARLLAHLSGPGQCIWEVAMARDPKYDDKDREATRTLLQIGFKPKRVPASDHPNHKGKGDWQVFDLGERHWSTPAEAAEFKPQVALDSYGLWKWDYDRRDETLWYAITPAGTRLPLRLEKDDGFPRCYTFIPGPQGAPPQIAVGHFWGFTVFSLSPVEAKIVRRCLGHHGEVMSIAPFDPNYHPAKSAGAYEPKHLVTSGRDQTISFWSLEPWPGHPELGASFRPDGDWLRVETVQPGSPASEVFKAGDLLGDFEYNRQKVAGGPAKWLEVITNSPPGPFCGFNKVVRDGKPLGGVGSSMRQRPLWRMLPMSDREWVLWRHADFYYDTSTKGDFRIGWQLSGEVRQTPEFFRAEMFRARFHDPKKVEDMVTTFKRSAVETVAIPQLLPPTVTLKVVAPPTADADARVLVTATRRGVGPGQALNLVNLWVNDCLPPQNALRVSGDSFSREFVVPRSFFRAGRNRLTAQAFSRLEVRDEKFVDVTLDRPQRQPNLYGLVIGIDDYSAANVGGKTTRPDGKTPWLNKLNAGLDASALKEGWAKQQGKMFDKVDLELLTESKVTRENVLTAAKQLAGKVGADDYVLFSLGGHGVTGAELHGIEGLTDKERPKPDAFIFLTHAVDLQRPRTTAIDGDDLFAAIRALPARKIVLLDTCHSGSKVNPVRKLAPAGMGPVLLSACESHQSARENLDFARAKGFGNSVRGVFSIALLLALDQEFAVAAQGNDPEPPTDRYLKANKLVEYLADVVPSAATGIDRNAAQNPVAFLPESERELPVAAK